MFKIILCSVLAASIALFIYSYSPSGTSNLKAIEVIDHYPMTVSSENGEPVPLNDTIAIFYSGDYILYRLRPATQVNTFRNIKGSETYFIFHNKDKYGFFFKSLNDTSQGQKFLVDSVLSQNCLQMGPFDTSLCGYHLNKVRTGGTLIHQYLAPENKAECEPDSIDFYFSNSLKDITYSISPKLDSIEKMKLFRIYAVFNAHFSQLANANIPRSEFLFEIRRFTNYDYELVNNLFERVKTRDKTRG